MSVLGFLGGKNCMMLVQSLPDEICTMLLTLWWLQISPQVPGRSTFVTRPYSLEAWEVFEEILWQISRSHWQIPEVGQGNGERFIPRIIFIWSLFNQLWATCRVPPEQMQCQRNYGSFLSESHLHGMILLTMLAQNCPKSKRQCFNRVICYFKIVNIRHGEATAICLRSRGKTVFHWKKRKLITPIKLNCTN